MPFSLLSILTHTYVLWAAGSIAGIFLFLFFLRLIRFFLRRLYRSTVAFQLRIFLVTVPKEASRGQDKEDRGPMTLEMVRERVAVAETLFASIGGLRAERGMKAWFFGREDHLSFEIVALDDVISFYVVVSPRLAQYVHEQIQAQYPESHIEEVEDYNLFSARGVIAADMLRCTRPSFFPLKTYKKIDSDSLNALTNALSTLDAGEGAAIQYTTRSAHGRWHTPGRRIGNLLQQGKTLDEALADVRGSIFRKLFSSALKQQQSQQPMRPTLSPMESERVKGIEEKTSKAGLDVNIRILVSAPDAARAEQKLHNIVNAFHQFNIYEYGNALEGIRPLPRQVIRQWWYRLIHEPRVIRAFIYRFFDERRSMVLNTEEMAGLFHFPLPSLETPNIRWLTAKRVAPPVNLPDEGIVLGRAIYRGEEHIVRIKRKDRQRHTYIIGKSGSGKSVLIGNMAKQDIQNGEGVCVIDPHGDLVEDILTAVPKERAEDVIVFNPSDMERPVGLNMLEVKTEDQKDFAVQEMISIFYKLFPPEMIGPMFEHHMRNVMLTLMSDTENPGTITDIPRMFSDPDFSKEWIQKLHDPVVRAYWEKEVAKTSDFHKSEMLGYLISKVGRFVENTMMRNIIGQAHSGFDFRSIMDQKKILLVNLAKGRTGEVNADLLGLIIVAKIQMAAFARAELPEEQRHDFYLYIDEFQNFITDSIATILSEARKYRLNLIIGHQYMGQLVKQNDTKIRDAVLGNVGTMIVYRIGVEDTETLAKEFAPTLSAYDLINSDQYTAYVKLLIDNTTSRPFNMKPYAPVAGDPAYAAKLKELSRLKYGRARRIVEAEILERTKLGEATVGEDSAGIETTR